jgi:DNA-binding GntR family transcriptional regulator
VRRSTTKESLPIRFRFYFDATDVRIVFRSELGATLMTLEYLSLREQARRTLRTIIVTGELIPGKLYPISQISEMLGVSATPVREALADLGHAGLVDMVRNRGFVVRELTDHDLDEILELRLMLEVPAMQRLCGHIGPVDELACLTLVDSCRIAASRGDIEGFLEADREFHLKLLGIQGNKRLVQMVDQLRDETRLHGLPNLARKYQLVESADEHEQLLKALVSGDENGGEFMATHIRHIRGIWAGHSEEEGSDRWDA